MTQSKCKEPSDDDKPNFDEEVVTKEDQLNVVYFYSMGEKILNFSETGIHI